jgi:hypothetical protein
MVLRIYISNDRKYAFLEIESMMYYRLIEVEIRRRCIIRDYHSMTYKGAEIYDADISICYQLIYNLITKNINDFIELLSKLKKIKKVN